MLASFGMGAHALADELSVAGKNQLSDPEYIAPNLLRTVICGVSNATIALGGWSSTQNEQR